jgi:hypothetical protein
MASPSSVMVMIGDLGSMGESDGGGETFYQKERRVSGGRPKKWRRLCGVLERILVRGHQSAQTHRDAFLNTEPSQFE